MEGPPPVERSGLPAHEGLLVSGLACCGSSRDMARSERLSGLCLTLPGQDSGPFHAGETGGLVNIGGRIAGPRPGFGGRKARSRPRHGRAGPRNACTGRVRRRRNGNDGPTSPMAGRAAPAPPPATRSPRSRRVQSRVQGVRLHCGRAGCLITSEGPSIRADSAAARRWTSRCRNR